MWISSRRAQFSGEVKANPSGTLANMRASEPFYMRRKPAPLILFATLALVLATALWWGSPWWRARQLMRQSVPIQTSLEAYRQQRARYPVSLSEIGIVEREEGPIYYRRESESAYILWFGTTLGESETYHSTDRHWR